VRIIIPVECQALLNNGAQVRRDTFGARQASKIGEFVNQEFHVVYLLNDSARASSSTDPGCQELTVLAPQPLATA